MLQSKEENMTMKKQDNQLSRCWSTFSIQENLLGANFVVCDVPTNGLVAYYPFNRNANDESGKETMELCMEQPWPHLDLEIRTEPIILMDQIIISRIK